MEDQSSLFSVEDDGSLLILSRIISNESNVDSDLTITGACNSSIQDDYHHLQLLFGEENSETHEYLQKDIGGNVSVANLTEDVNESQDDDADADISLIEINQILEKEYANLELLRHETEIMKSMITILNSGSFQTTFDKTEPKEINIPRKTEDSFKDMGTEKRTLNESEVGVSVKSYQKRLSKSSNNPRRRRHPGGYNQAATTAGNNPFNLQTFVQDYYRSLDTVSRYIIFASIVSFLTAFLLLSWYSAQTHYHDMELFQLKEKRVLANQEEFEKYQLEKENFRESIIHQRYEESRQCQSSLQSCHAKRDELLAQIAQYNESTGKSKKGLEFKVQSQKIQIQILNDKYHEMQEENIRLRRQLGQYFPPTHGNLLLSFLNFCNSRFVQIIFVIVITVISAIAIVNALMGK